MSVSYTPSTSSAYRTGELCLVTVVSVFSNEVADLWLALPSNAIPQFLTHCDLAAPRMN